MRRVSEQMPAATPSESHAGEEPTTAAAASATGSVTRISADFFYIPAFGAFERKQKNYIKR